MEHVEFLRTHHPDLFSQRNDSGNVLHACVNADNVEVIAFLANGLVRVRQNLLNAVPRGQPQETLLYKAALLDKPEVVMVLNKLMATEKHGRVVDVPIYVEALVCACRRSYKKVICALVCDLKRISS